MRSAFLVSSPRPLALRALNYAREIEDLARPRGGAFQATRLASLLSAFGDSYWAVFTRVDCAREHGIELISQTDMFAAEPEGRVIRKDSMQNPDLHEVRRWQVLIAGAGQMGAGNLFGRSIVADERVMGKFLGPHAVGLTFREPGSDINLWTYAFLNTALGAKAIKAAAFGTSVPGLRLDLLGEIPIPIPKDTKLLRRVAVLVRQATEQRDRYSRELRAARRVFEELPEMRAAHAACASRKPRRTMWTGSLRTLCAWNAASTGDALAALQTKWPCRLGDLVATDGVFYGPRFARTSCDPPHGVDFMSQRDAFLIRPAPRRIAHPGFADEKLFVPPNTLLVGAQGTLGEGEVFGKVMLVRGRLARMAYTQHLLRIAPKRTHSSTLFAFLSTLVGLRLLRSTAVGTKLLSMREDLLRELPIPELEARQRQLVDGHVDAAFDALETAADAEREAIQNVDEVLAAWLA